MHSPWISGDWNVQQTDSSHDILHLLDALPTPTRSPAPSSPSLSSWSLPSDAEDTFALSGDEEHAAHAEQKRRYWVEGLREARLREREKEDDEAQRDKEMRAELVLNEPVSSGGLTLLEVLEAAVVGLGPGRRRRQRRNASMMAIGDCYPAVWTLDLVSKLPHAALTL